MKHIIVLFLFFQLLTVSAFAQQYKYHIVKRGETTAEIARMYNVTEETIFKYNPDARKGIKPNSKLVVPLTPERSNEQNVKFKEHRVQRKETLFSLSQQYNVDIDDIKRYNKHLYSQELRRGERIRIPLNLPRKEQEQRRETSGVNPLDLTVKEHLVLPQETLYGISRKYNITIADLQRLNPNLETLKPGMILKVKNGNVEKVIDVEGDLFKYYQVQPQETLFSLTRRFGISRDSLVTLNPALADGLKSGMVLKIPNKEVPEYESYSEEGIVNLEKRISNYDTKNLVVMLPFHLNKIVKTDTSDNAAERIKKDRVLQISLDFYSGVLMAIDSAKALGISTKLTTFDTQQNPGKVHTIINTNDFSGVDAVIGPLVQSTTEAAASGLERRGIPVVAPFTKNGGYRDNLLQARPSDELLSQTMISYISQNAAGKNLIIIADAASSAKKQELMSAFPSARIVNPKEGSYIDQNELSAALVEGKPNWVILEANKIGVISNVTSYLNSLADKYKVTLFTTDRNNSFDSDNISNRHLSKLNFHYPSVDRVYSPEIHKGFIKKYTEKYGAVPNRYAVRGFDVTYDILLRLASASDLASSLSEEGTTQYVENKFDYDPNSTGGFTNKAIYILSYDKDLNLKVVQ